MKHLLRAAARASACLAAALTAFSVQAASPLADVVETSAGSGHTCARTSAGGVWCWGSNASGQLGDGTAASYPAPVAVSGLSSGVAAIAAGGRHSCALTAGGGVKCWGENSFGQLGDGTTTHRLAPVDVAGLSSGVAWIWAGFYHTCAATTGGAMKCWGANGNGQLGDGTVLNRSTPVNVVGMSSGITGGSAGGLHTCALAGTASYCWGANDAGQLGDNTQTQRTMPVFTSGLAPGVASIRAGGSHTCALTTDGVARCWGANSNGQLGTGSTGGFATMPRVVSGLSTGVVSFTLGYAHTCALLASGAKCWGTNLQFGLGDTGTDRGTPSDVPSIGVPVSAMTAGSYHTCATGNDAKVRCWGQNFEGELGRGTSETRTPVPALVQVFVHTPLENATAVSAGFSHACALLSNGGVRCWGSNVFGELGDGSTTARTAPVDVTGLSSGVVAIANAASQSCAVTTGGTVKCWGRNHRGQLGDGTQMDRSAPVDVIGVSGATAVFMGVTHACAVVSAGALKCWGDNGYGQLGDGSSVSPRLSAVDVTGLGAAVLSGGAGDRHTCVLTTGGGVKCWGENAVGQLGDGTATSRPQPVDVSGLASGVTALVSGDFFNCALTSAQGVKCWGLNGDGRLGIGSSGGTYNTPQAAAGLASGVTQISVGRHTACALMSAGGVRCWGYNFFGELGFPGNPGFNAGSPTPTAVQYPLANPVTLAVGGNFQCVITTAGRVSCWGTNSNGQFGRGYSGTIPFAGYSPSAGVLAMQAIAFPALADRNINDPPFTVAASSDAGLPVTLSSLTGSVCTVSGTSVTLVANGTCTIAADQGGNLDYLPATRLLRSFAVTGTRAQLGRLVNISTRALVQTGHNVMIAGLIIAPDRYPQPKTVVIRARGPSLSTQGVTGVLANPKLQVVRSHDQAVLATNDDWQQASNAAAIQSSGFAPLDPAEPAVLLTLSGGLAYTAIVSGVNDGTGVAIVEVFEVNAPDVPLFDLATRANVLTGNDVLIGGFIIQGELPRTVIVRARGPSMAQQGVTGLLQNPLLQIFSGQTQIATNDDWQTDPGAGQLGIYAPTDSREAAIRITLNPGAYTAIVSGVGGTTGIAIVEILVP